MFRISHCLDNRLTDGGKFVCLTRRPLLTPSKTISGTHFCYMSQLQGHNAAGRIRQIKQSSDLIEKRTGYLETCSMVRQLNILQRAPPLSKLCIHKRRLHVLNAGTSMSTERQKGNSAIWLDSDEEDLKEMVITGREKNATVSGSNGE
jgi:hypothetical protein